MKLQLTIQKTLNLFYKSTIYSIATLSSICILIMGCQMAVSQKVEQPKKISQRQKKSKLIDCRRKSTMFAENVTQNVTIIRDKLEKAELKFAARCLSEHEFFSTLKDQQIDQITKGMVVAEGIQGQYVFSQGDPGNSFFIIYTGQVDVQVDGVYIRTLTDGKSFGQLALLFRTERTASIKCKQKNNIFFVVKPALFRQSLKKLKIYEFEKNKKMIGNVQIFNGLTNKNKQLISQNLKTIYFEKNQIIFNAGDPANSFYIISSGQVKVEIPEKEPIILKTFQSFGENAFKQNSKRLGTAVALQETVCCFLHKSDLDNIFGKDFHNIFYYNMKKWALLRSQYFKGDPYLINRLISKFQVKRAQQGDILVESLPTGLIINLQGSINGKAQGSMFCEKTYADRTTLSNPIIKNDAGDYAYLAFSDIDKMMREIQELKSLKSYSKKNLPLDKENMQNFNLSKFYFIKQLGQGQFGKVYLVRDSNFGGQLYAVKCLSKQAVQKQSMEKCVIQQKKILSKIVFPYIVGFAEAYHDQKYIYFLMQYIKGKQMFDVIREMPIVKKNIATYFFGCMLLAIQHLHQNNIIYRDIKPQNSVIDYTGKAFLVDLGTAKVLKKQTFYRTFTLIGTPHYMAPEIFQGNGYSFQADIWSLGILLYEFLCARLPFGEEDNDPYIVMKKIKFDPIPFPQGTFINPQAKQVLQLLLQKNPKVRSIKATFDTIKKSAYFCDLDWNDLLHEKLQPPYIPKDFRKQKQHQNTLRMEGKPLGQFLYGKSFIKSSWSTKLWNEEFN